MPRDLVQVLPRRSLSRVVVVEGEEEEEEEEEEAMETGWLTPAWATRVSFRIWAIRCLEDKTRTHLAIQSKASFSSLCALLTETFPSLMT